MPDLAVFEFGQSEVRIVGTKDKPMFVVADVCRILGIRNPADAVKKFPEEQKGIDTIYTPGGRQEMLTVTEHGLYVLTMASKKPQAEDFKWKVADVCVCIRQHGCYPAPIVEVGNRAVVPFDPVQFSKSIADGIGVHLSPIKSDVDELKTDVKELREDVKAISPRRKNVPTEVVKLHCHVVLAHYAGKCPCCNETLIVHPETGEKLQTCHVEHWRNRWTVTKAYTWIVCVDCNEQLKDPEFHDGASPFFQAYQKRRKAIEHSINPTLPGFGDIVD